MFGSTNGQTPKSESTSRIHAINKTSPSTFMRLAAPAELLHLRLESSRTAYGDFMSDDKQPNNALEPTADGAFTFMITDNITSPALVMPLAAAVAQLGR